MTHPPNAAHANIFRGSCTGGNGRGQARTVCIEVSTSHDEMMAPLALSPPKIAERPSLNTHPTQSK